MKSGFLRKLAMGFELTFSYAMSAVRRRRITLVALQFRFVKITLVTQAKSPPAAGEGETHGATVTFVRDLESEWKN